MVVVGGGQLSGVLARWVFPLDVLGVLRGRAEAGVHLPAGVLEKDAKGC